MKKILKYTILLVVIGLLVYFIRQETLSPCQKTLEYSIDRFDTQFGISEEEFKNYIAESETVWEKTIGRDVFVYKSDAPFKINLIYDERQLETVQKQKTEFGLSAVEEAFKNLDSRFEIFKNQYEQRVSSYQIVFTEFERRKAIYDAEVENFNSKGGAPKNKYDALNEERQYLNSEAEKLNKEALVINAMTSELNALLKERNTKAAEYNRIAEEYNKKYNDGLEFNQAEYKTGDLSTQAGEINVYQFGNKKDLIFALIHEFGHALGLEHVDNPKSIMYYLASSNITVSPALSEQDLAELDRVCKI
jgi:hypothetical protein